MDTSKRNKNQRQQGSAQLNENDARSWPQASGQKLDGLSWWYLLPLDSVSISGNKLQMYFYLRNIYQACLCFAESIHSWKLEPWKFPQWRRVTCWSFILQVFPPNLVISSKVESFIWKFSWVLSAVFRTDQHPIVLRFIMLEAFVSSMPIHCFEKLDSGSIVEFWENARQAKLWSNPKQNLRRLKNTIVWLLSGQTENKHPRNGQSFKQNGLSTVLQAAGAFIRTVRFCACSLSVKWGERTWFFYLLGFFSCDKKEKDIHLRKTATFLICEITWQKGKRANLWVVGSTWVFFFAPC